MDKEIVIALIGAFSGVVGAASVAFLAWRKLRDELALIRSQAKVNQSQERVNDSEAANNIVEAANQALGIFKAAIQQSENRNKELIDNSLKASVHINSLEDRIEELNKRLDEQELKTASYRHEREAWIQSLETRLEDMGRQILDWNNRFNEMKEKYNQALELVIGLLDEDKRAAALERLSHILGDSVYKFKLPRPGRTQ